MDSPSEYGARLAIYVEVSGGLVQSVFATCGAQVTVQVIDHDLERALDPQGDPDERIELAQRREKREALLAAIEAQAVVPVW